MGFRKFVGTAFLLAGTYSMLYSAAVVDGLGSVKDIVKFGVIGLALILIGQEIGGYHE